MLSLYLKLERQLLCVFLIHTPASGLLHTAGHILPESWDTPHFSHYRLLAATPVLDKPLGGANAAQAQNFCSACHPQSSVMLHNLNSTTTAFPGKVKHVTWTLAVVCATQPDFVIRSISRHIFFLSTEVWILCSWCFNGGCFLKPAANCLPRWWCINSTCMFNINQTHGNLHCSPKGNCHIW